MSRHVFVVFKEGPEWNESVEGWLDKKKAEHRAAELNRNKGDGTFDSLSTYRAVPICVRDMSAEVKP